MDPQERKAGAARALDASSARASRRSRPPAQPSASPFGAPVGTYHHQRRKRNRWRRNAGTYIDGRLLRP